MSCEQAIYQGYVPKYKPFNISTTQSLAECSQKCCDTNTMSGHISGSKMCGIYSYMEDTGVCALFNLPDQPFYLPLPSVRDMINVGNQKINTGILMKRKIITWLPWIMMIVGVLLIIFGYPFGSSKLNC